MLELSLADQPDTAILTRAVETGATIVTKDADFMHLTKTATACGIVWIRFGNASSGDLLLSLEPIWSDIESALAAGQRLVEISR